MSRRLPDNELKRPRQRRNVPNKGGPTPYAFSLPIMADFSAPETLAEAITLRQHYAISIGTMAAAEARQSENLRRDLLADRRQCLEALNVAIGGVDVARYRNVRATVACTRKKLAKFQAELETMESEYVR
jgi:hypothetical protein